MLGPMPTDNDVGTLGRDYGEELWRPGPEIIERARITDYRRWLASDRGVTFHSAGSDPATPRPAGSDPATPRPAGSDPATPRPAGSDPATPPHARTTESSVLMWMGRSWVRNASAIPRSCAKASSSR